MALVLCTGVHSALMKTRQLILERAGHSVITATDPSAVVRTCHQHKFDVAVIGQATSRDVKRQIMSEIRKLCPGAKVLELYRFPMGKVLEDADAWLEVPMDIPQELAERVDALLND